MVEGAQITDDVQARRHAVWVKRRALARRLNAVLLGVFSVCLLVYAGLSVDARTRPQPATGHTFPMICGPRFLASTCYGTRGEFVIFLVLIGFVVAIFAAAMAVTWFLDPTAGLREQKKRQGF